MQKQIHINVEKEVQEELKNASNKSDHQKVHGSNGQMVDAHFNMNEPQLTIAEIGRGQVETLLVLQTDSETLREIENVETEAEVISRIQWGKKKKKKSKKGMY